MTKTEQALLLQRIESLEKQVAALQARPFYPPAPIFPPLAPAVPMQPTTWPPYVVTSIGDATGCAPQPLGTVSRFEAKAGTALGTTCGTSAH